MVCCLVMCASLQGLVQYPTMRWSSDSRQIFAKIIPWPGPHIYYMYLHVYMSAMRLLAHALLFHPAGRQLFLEL